MRPINIFQRLPIVVVLFFVCGHLHAQNPVTPKIIPPSPNAAAFSKYGNIPVSTYTGVPNINIPLYEINIRDIKVPISLSYHASGIKVGDEASRVGLGWVLNAGGVISRNIIYMDDLHDIPQNFLSSMNDSPPIPQGPNSPPASLVQGNTIYGYYSTQSQSGTPFYLDLTRYLVPTGIDPLFKPTDFEPDQFNYNFLDYSGKFVMNRYREVILEKQTKIKIHLRNDTNWEITTPDGFVYKFLEYEYFTENGGGHQQKSAWYLTQIVSPQNETVNFYYTLPTNQFIIPVGSFHERQTPHVLSCTNMPCQGSEPSYGPIEGKQYSNISLDRIEWSHGKIKFNVAMDRQDIAGEKRITSIQIFKKDAAEPYEEIVLSHDYFTSSSAGPVNPNEFSTQNYDKALKRLKLTGLTRRSLASVNNQPEEYSFSYYEQSPFPPKTSYARDHWGYYNGKTGNTSLIPKFSTVVSTNTTLTDIVGLMGSEREPSATHAELLSLKSIIYPTKGTTTFYYQPNDYEYDAAIDNDTGGAPETYQETDGFAYTITRGQVQSTAWDLRDEYVNQQGHSVPVTMNAAFKTNMTIPCNQVTGAPNVYFELINEDSLSFGVITPNGSRCTSPDDPQCQQNQNLDCVSCCSGSMVFTLKKAFVLPPGKYYWKAYIGETETQINDISAMYTWTVDARKRPQSGLEPDGSIKKYRLGGGLRVSRIEDYDPDSDQKYNIRKYEYHYKTDVDGDGRMESHSYGRRMAKPSYSYYDVTWEKLIVAHEIRKCLNCYTLIRDSGHPLANYDGIPVGYSKLIEYLGENGEGGYTEYEYENIADEIKAYKYPLDQDVPIQPPLYNTVKNPGNGNLKRLTHFSATGAKVLETENIYLSKYRNVMYGLSSRKIRADENVTTESGPFLLLLYETLGSNFPYLSETTTKHFLPSGIESHKSYTQYFYDKPEHLQLTKQVTEESNLHKTITTYKYPADYSNAESSAAIASMKDDKFMHSLPVETTVSDEVSGVEKIKHREFTVYETFNGLVFPKEKVILENTDLLASVPPYIPSGTYDQQLYKKIFSLDYNASGNLKKIQKTSDISVGYLWGHNQTLLIAEIKNGTADQSFFTSFEEDGNLYADESGLNLARTGVKVKTSASYTFPSTYTPIASNTMMSYWYWQDNQWNFSGIIPFQNTITTTGSKIDEVRAFAKGALMTTFTHLPMVGMSSQTDANNMTTYYEYDERGRLKLIRDNEKKILKSYEYAYKK